MNMKAQNDTSICMNQFSFEACYYYGKLLKIYDVFPESKSASALDFRIGLSTHGKKYWHQQYNYPDVKLTFSYSGYGNRSVLGNSLSIYPVHHYLFKKKLIMLLLSKVLIYRRTIMEPQKLFQKSFVLSI